MSKRFTAQLVGRFKDALAKATWFPDEVRQLAPAALGDRLEQHFAAPSNRDARGVRSAAKQDAKRTVAHLVRAIRLAREHPDPNVRAHARKLVRSVQPLGFSELVVRASRFIGHLNKVGRSTKERERRARRKTIQIDDCWRLTELNSGDQLQEAGRVLGLCTAKRDDFSRAYFEELRDGRTSFYRLDGDSGPAGLLSMDVDSRCIQEASGQDNGELAIDRAAALKVLRKLNASANDVEAFSKVGAFSEFCARVPRTDPIKHRERQHWVWCFTSGRLQTVIVGQRSGGRATQWSRFERRCGGRRRRSGRARRTRRGGWVERCHHDGAMELGLFMELLIDCPRVYAAIHGAFASEADLAPQEPLPFGNASCPSPGRPVTLSAFGQPAPSEVRQAARPFARPAAVRLG